MNKFSKEFDDKQTEVIKKECYQLVGWASSIKPEERNSRNYSDGCFFSSESLACMYAVSNKMHVMRIQKHEKVSADVIPHIEYCDSLVKDFIK